MLETAGTETINISGNNILNFPMNTSGNSIAIYKVPSLIVFRYDAVNPQLISMNIDE